MEREIRAGRVFQAEPNFPVVPFQELLMPVRFVAEGMVAGTAAIARSAAAAAEAFRRLQERNRTIRELRGLPDSVLKDIGIERGSITLAVHDIENGVDPRRR